ncbi:MAG: adenylosuccinate lyase [Ignavibacteria bacterium RIFOXYB2_FULL_35_12]|nr:MAG: adenylosuccinate lyase [Ignavibacteria bacterium GWA2_36_19]OGU51530.1 MAG: adenylosuccinate lyase [Ignavibacteria bacterium GWC2_35_8]OGU57125.1 MAG: adenylosuccinate lyase [Ignavibacteria bacterium GWF2_35_20]OGU83438.1 MAG: adenylosuccinate lyase [Ignavibacteria bacterium RIFOXYA2_FULL_35_9]OGU88885.1 MAG: adenylosuccinate lyase [Ignavibacteria bacterium RIFOXYA12_FULL_35_25]OGU90617.1 MAG: adenylosuccinate lyase [Ignavibacteria bacterium RIFOXYC12_FULL_35_11]OGU94524.1 MAG: adenyl
MIERYTLPEMGKIWTEDFKFSTWLKIEILASEARCEMGDIPKKDLDVIKQKANFNSARVLEIEETTKHDVIAFLTNVAEYVGNEARHIHYGMTSSDILDTSLSFQMKTAGEILLKKLTELKSVLKNRAIEFKYTVCVGRSHGIHAEPTTMGLKFALWFEECKRNISRLEKAIKTISVGKISGAVGTFEHLSPEVEKFVCEHLGLKPAPVSTQIIQRDRHAEFLSTLAIIGTSLEKIALEVRHLQKTEVLEAEEFFSKGQKGSSAMPHKRNPVISERIAGIARIVRANASASLENIPLWHERDISHSSTERVIIPDSCIALDYILNQTTKLVQNLILYPDNMLKNLNLTRGLIFSQTVLLALINQGVSREDSYKFVQDCAMAVWNDQSKNLRDELNNSDMIRKYLAKEEIDFIFDNKKMLKNVDFIFKRTVEAD